LTPLPTRLESELLVGLHRPNAARIDDYLLGGDRNFDADRRAARQALREAPWLPTMAAANLCLLQRSIRDLVMAGIDQFLDFAGLHAYGGVVTAVLKASPNGRVVHISADLVAVQLAHREYAGDDRIGVLAADIRHPDTIFKNPQTLRMLDVTRPVAVIMGTAVQHIPGDIATISAALHARMAPGSYLVMSHATSDHPDPDARDIGPLISLYENTPTPLQPRPHAELSTLFDGFDLLDGGVVDVTDCVPGTRDLIGEPPPGWPRVVVPLLAGVGRRP
jgi:hypothetical protein